MFQLDEQIRTGIGHSDFQAAPEPKDGAPVTDWEKALVDHRGGKSNFIKGSVEDLPDFRRDYKKQVDLVCSELENKSFRISLDFGRLCPRKGEFDEELMGHYITALAYCRKKGVEPMVTLHHWPMPLSYCEVKGPKITRGGWEHPEILDHFKFYIKKVGEYLLRPDKIKAALKKSNEFTDEEIDRIINERILCKEFITINEPVNYFITPYVAGAFAPFHKGRVLKGYQVLNKVAEAHDIAYHEMHEAAAQSPEISRIREEVRLGVAHNFTYFEGNSLVTNALAGLAAKLVNWHIADKFEEKGSDFVAVQYYFRLLLGLWGKKLQEREYGDHPEFGDIYPPGIEKILLGVADRYPNKKIKVTEFGFADKKDTRRPYWIMETVRYILEAKQKGAPVDAVYLWSIINNLEWVEGMDVPFGMYEHTGERLKTDTGASISSRQVWTLLCRYLNQPTEENRRKVLELYKLAKSQHEAHGADEKITPTQSSPGAYSSRRRRRR